MKPRFRMRRYVGSLSETDFRINKLIQDALIRSVEINGEATRKIKICDPGFSLLIRNSCQESIRNRPAYGYFAINLGLAGETVQRDVLALEVQVKKLPTQPVSR
jgi:uncharacterized protein with HEPN domain